MKIKNKDSSIIITITPEAIISRGKEQEVDITLKEARTILSRLAKDPDYLSDTMDDFNNKKFEEYIDQLTDLVFKKLIEKYGPIYPLNFGMDNEEILISELARLNTILCMLEETEQFEKCAIVKNRIRNIEATLKNMK